MRARVHTFSNYLHETNHALRRRIEEKKRVVIRASTRVDGVDDGGNGGVVVDGFCERDRVYLR